VDFSRDGNPEALLGAVKFGCQVGGVAEEEGLEEGTPAEIERTDGEKSKPRPDGAGFSVARSALWGLISGCRRVAGVIVFRSEVSYLLSGDVFGVYF